MLQLVKTQQLTKHEDGNAITTGWSVFSQIHAVVSLRRSISWLPFCGRIRFPLVPWVLVVDLPWLPSCLIRHRRCGSSRWSFYQRVHFTEYVLVLHWKHQNSYNTCWRKIRKTFFKIRLKKFSFIQRHLKFLCRTRTNRAEKAIGNTDWLYSNVSWSDGNVTSCLP